MSASDQAASLSLPQLARARIARLDEIARAVEAGPDNPRITRISANAFVVRFADLGAAWSAQAQDHAGQHQAIAKMVRGGQVSQLRDLTAGRPVGRTRNSDRFAAEVVARARPLVAEVIEAADVGAAAGELAR